MAGEYKVENTQPTFYQDAPGHVIQGYQIQVRLNKWNEIHTIQVPNLQTDTVDQAVRALIAQREAIDRLGG